jgi:hypothetical protein
MKSLLSVLALTLTIGLFSCNVDTKTPVVDYGYQTLSDYFINATINGTTYNSQLVDSTLTAFSEKVKLIASTEPEAIYNFPYSFKALRYINQTSQDQLAIVLLDSIKLDTVKTYPRQYKVGMKDRFAAFSAVLPSGTSALVSYNRTNNASFSEYLSLTVTSIDTLTRSVSGTFFTMPNSPVTVTAGSFKLRLKK